MGTLAEPHRRAESPQGYCALLTDFDCLADQLAKEDMKNEWLAILRPLAILDCQAQCHSYDCNTGQHNACPLSGVHILPAPPLDFALRLEDVGIGCFS
jgi:hypothetical protein